MKALTLLMALLLTGGRVLGQECFPDGEPIGNWFGECEAVDVDALGKRYVVTDFGVKNDSTLLQTAGIQAVIDRAASDGGGVIVLPEGTFLSGALFFRQGTHLHLEAGAVLKGSDDIGDFPVVDTRLEGQCLRYFAALVNADGVDGFSISGKGTIDGNGSRYWRSFWLRREVNPQCTNLEELRPRLVYISNCCDVRLSGVRLVNSPFWTTHLYRCRQVKLVGLYIFAPAAPVKAPSCDAVDVDVCRDVLIKDCYMSVNDDAVALKGGKGPWADRDPNNGGNYNIVIEDCRFGFCHSGLTCGSESVHNRNVILRRCRIDRADRLLWLKMRPDTPQRYEYIRVEDVSGSVRSLLYIKPWTQFFDLKDRVDIPLSYANNVSLRNIVLDCETFFDVTASDQYELRDFSLEHLRIRAKDGDCDRSLIPGLVWEDVEVDLLP